MLRIVAAHAGQLVAPHDLWRAWNHDPLVVAGLALAVWAYRRGRRQGPRRQRDTRRARCFAIALLAIALALLSPLEALSGALASAHMVQHLLLVVVAAPLMASSAPSSTLLRGCPVPVRQAVVRWRRRWRAVGEPLRTIRHPVAAWLLPVGTLWFWHAAVPYDMALRHDGVHVTEHTMLLFTAVLFWWVVAGARAVRVSPGLGVLMVFGMALQAVFLSLLLTFARSPWYDSYAATTTRWGIGPLADQQLAGVIMWVPAGGVYVAAALALMAAWLRSTEHVDVAPDAGNSHRRRR